MWKEVHDEHPDLIFDAMDKINALEETGDVIITPGKKIRCQMQFEQYLNRGEALKDPYF